MSRKIPAIIQPPPRPLTGADRRAYVQKTRGRLPGNSPALVILAEEMVDLG